MIEQLSGLSSATDGIMKSVSETRYVTTPNGIDGVGGVEQVSFTDTLANVSQEAVDRIKAGEAASIAGVDGQASVQQVVEAVMAAESSLQTAIAIRDKVVTAYQEISRMTI
ncbi:MULTISPECIES: flagellar hook-basal body complex protein FliE [Roseibium]|uniref:Flagellar hook-basal body complex protein FliE n=1 Tax=Roseibium polysiphoniae TaxID=2571221 RepID=A0A927Q302_9HYPH|nr:flagellar hook-basal body complex protein FliE [Roseibium polysiphoniae]MBD8877011.1 flagellar hook-basal body complex protein FliE [Roseibium polysiphoniae]MBS8260809.1 flagellar hook-basal body protein FliE [Roseibium polysiphoniae]